MWLILAPELVFEIFRHFFPGLTLSVIEPKLFPWYMAVALGGAFLSHIPDSGAIS